MLIDQVGGALTVASSRAFLAKHRHPKKLLITEDDFHVLSSVLGPVYRYTADKDGPFIWFIATEVRIKDWKETNRPEVLDLTVSA